MAEETRSQDDLTLVMIREFPVAPETVFDAWTDPAILMTWWGPEQVTIPECDMDVRPGGAWRTVMKAPDESTMEVSGVYRKIDRPAVLSMTWAWTQDDGTRGHETRVDVYFSATPSGTRMKLVQTIFADTAQRDKHGQGWASSFAGLERVLLQRRA